MIFYELITVPLISVTGPKSAAYGSKDEGSDGDITLSQ